MININSNHKAHQISYIIWTFEEDEILLKKAEEYKFKNWTKIASFFQNKNSTQCRLRFKLIRKGIKKGKWNEDEDKFLMELVSVYGKNWEKISRRMKYRSGKQIRDRYKNILDPNINKDKFTKEEDCLLISLHHKHGNLWTFMSKYFKGRTGEMLKNRFHSSLKKKMFNDELSNRVIISKNDEEKDISINLDQDIQSIQYYNKIQDYNLKIEVILNELDVVFNDSTIEMKENILNDLLMCTKSKLEEYKKINEVNSGFLFSKF